MATENIDLNNKALVAFLQALALSVVAIDDLPNDAKTSHDFLQVFDGLLSDIQNQIELEEAEDIHIAAQVLRQNFETALNQARDAKVKFIQKN